eukprot:TRINITY_DN7182_c0_g1_i1.p1 TRINITY_DN7182_c0_g1~~TRINITY_DN7182_c0_g1_i1.p1  ORF type:complete len:847 (-),score=216.24 TRINITY_DN7182_c0_g1_i1:127-2667(-)
MSAVSTPRKSGARAEELGDQMQLSAQKELRSPAKKRKLSPKKSRSDIEEKVAQKPFTVKDWLLRGSKPAASAASVSVVQRLLTWQRKEEPWHRQPMLLREVLQLVGVRHLVNAAAAVSRQWRDEVHGPALWQTLRRLPSVRLSDELLVRESLGKRRLKGKLYKACRLGFGFAAYSGGQPAGRANEAEVLVRIIDLAQANSGKDDGLPTSFLREASNLAGLRHPNIIRHYGAELLQDQSHVLMCTEFVQDSFAAWFTSLSGQPARVKRDAVRRNFRQALSGLAYLHNHGIMHRNLKPDNIFIDQSGRVKIGDFCMSRALELPCQPCTPEDPKHRDQSSKEAKRLCYRSPEQILRSRLYGHSVDIWAIGCLLAEAMLGQVLFESDTEIQHLFNIFMVIGTPGLDFWREAAGADSFSVQFPKFTGFDFKEVAAAYCHGEADAKARLEKIAAVGDRSNILLGLQHLAVSLGHDGMMLLDRVICKPASRISAEEALRAPFFGTAVTADDGSADVREAGAASELLQGSSDSMRCTFKHFGLCADTAWEMLRARLVAERDWLLREGASGRLAALMEKANAGGRAEAVALMFKISGKMTPGLESSTVHLAAAVFDAFFSKAGSSSEPLVFQLSDIAATCLKLADVFAEKSREYYKLQNCDDYSELCGGSDPQKLLNCEKYIVPHLSFDLHLPTVHWFVRCYLAYGRFKPTGKTAKVACFLADLCLLDVDLLNYAPSLRAQCIVVLAACLAECQTTAGARVPMVDGRPQIELLVHWDQVCRERLCSKNKVLDATLAMQAVLRTLLVTRRELKSHSLDSHEKRHEDVMNSLTIPDVLPAVKLALYIVPESQMGLFS